MAAGIPCRRPTMPRMSLEPLWMAEWPWRANPRRETGRKMCFEATM